MAIRAWTGNMGRDAKKVARPKPVPAPQNPAALSKVAALGSGFGVAILIGLIIEFLSWDLRRERRPADECPCADEWAPPSAQAIERFEYSRGCDFDVLDEFPSQEEFDRIYWNKRPVLVRNGTFNWPARTKWSKDAIIRGLSDGWQGAAWFKASDYHASFYFQDYFKSGNASEKKITDTKVKRSKLDVGSFLCHDVCKPPSTAKGGSSEQIYLFDRDEWRKAAPELERDAIAPSPVAHHYDERWHERWSKYLLISAEGSGINFHKHTNAYNGLVFGRKRWFLYPPEAPMPFKETGSLPWFETIYKESWASTSYGQPGRNGLEQCMQGEGDLVYIPQHWWHATIALGEGIGLSGQFVRRLNEILGRVSTALRQKRVSDAIGDLLFILEHADEVETDVLVSCAQDAAVLHLQTGKEEEGVRFARLAIQYAEERGAGDVTRAKEIVRRME